ncbi:MAG TPA: class I SAM-dependent methyltransferase [Candidatus Obscuribacterales bacterium]
MTGYLGKLEGAGVIQTLDKMVKAMDSTEQFTGLASIYAGARPSYPPDALDYILRECRLREGDVLVDVGCGTGISSRLFAERGLSVIGIEPNADMLQSAKSSVSHFPSLDLQFRRGKAEDTGLAESCAHAVLCAQSFHWFDAEMALCEFWRITKTNGWVILMWNVRDNSDAFTKGYGDCFKKVLGDEKKAHDRHRDGEAILSHPLFFDGKKMTFDNSQQVNAHSLLMRSFSASYAPREEPKRSELEADLNELFKQYERRGAATLRYQTVIYLSRKLER